MTLEKKSLTLVWDALKELEEIFEHMPTFDSSIDIREVEPILLEAAERMKENYPYPHPLYAGQMIKPPHPIARLAYIMSLWINPNNHALDGGVCSSAMEKEAVEGIAQMIGWDGSLGHLCSGGTMANLEALWVAGELTSQKTILASEQAHYTHQRICGVLRLPFASVPVDSRARMDTEALRRSLDDGAVGAVVATMGTTATGSVDPLPEILRLREDYGFRLHADAAYGGYFTLVDNLASDAREALDVLSEVDSIVIDPHKHGLQPYGCGCVMFKDPSVGRLYKHDSAYTYFTSDELHLGEISLECSRPGAAAVALWATQRLLPMTRDGEFARGLASCRQAALTLHKKLEQDPRFTSLFPPELDIVVWSVNAGTASESSRLVRQIFDQAAEEHLHLAVATFPHSLLESRLPGMEWDQDTVACLRSCLMKPEHLDWVDEIWKALDTAARRVVG